MPGPRNIILLSDGTGNSSAKLLKTNVWRMYEAMDLTSDDQIAVYDNGVGTSAFKLFAVLGGGLGWGLKRNVLDLYMAACRNYVEAGPSRPADRLFAFGFSRGAFTIRVLLGLIADQGLITGVRGRELERQAKWAYRAYRRRFNTKWALVTPLRKARDVTLRLWEGLFRRRRQSSRRVIPDVAFVGLWDTVDAYGFPIDEMTRGWDEWIWPLSMCERQMPANVAKVCHAISIDDERHTFHPVLLQEDAATVSHIDRERVTQVWFAGVHSDVGGGYADGSIAYVSLLWMAGEAQKAPHSLRLLPHALAEWRSRVNASGPLNDSRRGLGSYYRYNPRNIKELSREVGIAAPKIHESVFRRIGAGPDDYAPAVLPGSYAVLSADGSVAYEWGNPIENPLRATAREDEQERIWDLVLIKRAAYFLTIWATLLVVVPPMFATDLSATPLAFGSRGATAVVGALTSLLPEMLRPWGAYYEHYPWWLIVFGGATVGLIVIGSRLQRAMNDRMEPIWRQVMHNCPPGHTRLSWFGRQLRTVRTNRARVAILRWFSHEAFPFLFGFGTLLLLVWVVIGTINREVFAIRSAAGAICVAGTPPPAAQVVDGATTWTDSFTSNELCHPTGIQLEAGSRYRIRIGLPEGGWCDWTKHVPSLQGLGSGESAVYVAALPFRRLLTAQWFVPVARIGDRVAEYHLLTSAEIEITPRLTGELFLFVNDAIGTWPVGTEYFYRNNDLDKETSGRRPARVTVTAMADADGPGEAPTTPPGSVGQRSRTNRPNPCTAG